MSSRESCSPPASQDCQRKRIARACEGCRLRKTKCDGGKPCRKCKASNIICTTWRSKKPKDKVYAKGYVDVLERRQSQLIAGLEDTYHRLVAARLWPGKELPEPSGHPLVHDILSVLQILETNDEDSEAENAEHDAEHKTSSDPTTSPTGSDFQNSRATQSPSADDCAIPSTGRTIAPRPTSAAPITPADSTPADSTPPQTQSLLSPIEMSGCDSSVLKSETVVPDSPLQTFESKNSGSSVDMSSSVEPAWANVGASFDNSIIIPGTPESCSPWDHQYSPDMTDLPMDLDFSLPAESFENSTLMQMQDQAKNTSASQWWLGECLPGAQFTEPMSTGGMDELSNMLYRDICSDTSMLEMYQEEFGLVNMDGSEGLL